MTAKQFRKSRKEAKEAYDKMMELKQLGFDLIYADEVMFVSKTLPDRTWSPVNQPLQMDMKQIS